MERKEALQEAIREIARQRDEIRRLRAAAREPIAIVGMACRLPGAASLDEYWTLLAEGRDAVTDVPPDRWNAAAFYDADPSAAGKMATRQGGFIDGVDRFDPQFFGIAPREAQCMDPQQRLLLEVAWEALEHANIAPTALHGSATGVFVGITCFDHAIRISRARENFNAYAGTGSALNMAPGRLSYVLGLTGPSMAIDTACSSSLVALHLACQSLRDRESRAAIVAGVHLILSPHVMVSFSQARMLAGDGRCKTFDASADGYSRGEGCGVVVLKRLADALADRDTVLGVIRGTAVNQDGPSGGLTVPNGTSQQAVMRRALEIANVAPTDVGYVEAHGTGTSLGDPIEVESVAAVYGAGRPAAHPLRIGSVKTNIGHLEPAAGMAGLIKLLLMFRHGVVPRHLHFETPNPHIPWQDLPVRVTSAAEPWPATDQPRIAALSAFGFSGTNGHVIVEEPPAAVRPSAHTSSAGRDGVSDHLIPLSAKSESALRALAARMAARLARDPDVDVAAVAYTAGVGRAHFPYRIAVQAATIADARAAFERFAEDPAGSGVRMSRAAGVEYRRDADALAARLATAYARRALDEIAGLYLEGVEIDWPRLFEDGVPARVTLPHYPFERQRYWIDAADEHRTSPTVAGYFESVWTSAGPAGAPAPRLDHRRWAIAIGGHDTPAVRHVADALRQALPPSGHDGTPPTDIIHLLGARGPDDAAEACDSLLQTAHSIIDAGGAVPRVWVVTRGALPVAGAMTSDGAALAPAAAFARVLGLEHPEMFGRVIDLDPAGPAADVHELLAEIAREDIEDQVALRGGERFVQRVERVAAPPAPSLRLRADAEYLVTGGLGRIGLAIAGALARRGAMHVCLVGRRGVSTPQQRAAIAAMESAGVSVRVAAADVSDRQTISALLDDITSARPLAGIVHAAGLPGYADMAQLTAADLADVLRPKVQGAWHLHELTRSRPPLDFFVCCSSIASAWGSRGQAHYAAANAFLDALAYLRRSAGAPAVTINWGPWADGGMTSPEAETLLRRVGIRPLATDDALMAFEAWLAGERAEIVVADIDMARFKGSYEARGHRPLLERLDAPAAPSTGPARAADNALARQLATAPPDRRERLLIDAIQRDAAQVLELGDPSLADPDQGLFEMGLDSLMALELRTRLETLVARALPATLVFDYPTIRSIARLLLREVAPAEPAPASIAAPDPDAVLDSLTEAEAEALLLQKLDAIR